MLRLLVVVANQPYCLLSYKVKNKSQKNSNKTKEDGNYKFAMQTLNTFKDYL